MCGLRAPTWVGAAPCLGPPTVRFERRCISQGVFMSKELVISATSHERRVAILEEGQLVEIYIEREKEFALVGSIYKGKVTRVLPGMQSAFVDIGLDGDAFLYVSDVFENLEDYEHGHAHGEPSAPAPVGQSGAPSIELLPGETLAAAGVHEEVIHLDEGHAEDGHAAEGRQESAGPRAEGEPADLEERQPESNASAPQNFAPNYNPTRNYPPRMGNDRGSGGDRGGRGRRGRWGRRRGGDRRPHGHGGGRNLPPSKYASPQGERDSRGYDRRGGDRGPSSAPPDGREDDILLPGESLAKYRGRQPQPPVEPVAEREPEERQPNFEQPTARATVGMQPGPGVPRRFSGNLPHWVLADNEAEGEAARLEEPGEAAVDGAETASGAAEEVQEEKGQSEVRNGTAGLSEEELSALSARLVEAKHEETQARAEADTLVGGHDFEEEEDEEHDVEELPEEHHEEIPGVEEHHAAEAEHEEEHEEEHEDEELVPEEEVHAEE